MKQLAVIIYCLIVCSGFATEFFISPQGDDANAGTSPDSAYKTLKHAAQFMVAGDTMTLLPGEYHQSLEWKFDGGDEITTIRAAVPGSVVLRGDVDIPTLTQSSFSARIWQCRYPELPQALNERDTLLIYTRKPSVEELEFNLASWFYDEAAQILYVHTSDSAPPDKHRLTISVLAQHGILIAGKDTNRVRNVLLADLIITGFNCNGPGGQPGNNAKWGVYLTAPQGCSIINTTTYLNGSGIGFRRGSSGSAIENCRSYANNSPYYGSGGNIIVLTPSQKTAIRNCLSFDSELAGIRFYGSTPAQHCVFEGNISFDNGYGDLWLKYPSDTTTARYCVAGKALYSRLIENCLFNYGDTGYFGAAKNSIVRPQETAFDAKKEFADPENHDYRPQADSEYRDRAPAPFSDTVYFVGADGDNQATGNSVRHAWRSLDDKLKDDATFYLLPDSLHSGIKLTNLKNVSIRGRGSFPVKIEGEISIENCENVRLERLSFTALKVDGSRQISINQCSIEHNMSVQQTKEFQITHCVLNKLQLNAAGGGVITANIFLTNGMESQNSTFWSDYNSYVGKVPIGETHSFAAIPEFGPNKTLKNSNLFDGRSIDSMPVGPYRRQPRPEPLQLDGPKLLSRTANTANVEFHANYLTTGTFFYGKTQDCENSYSFKPELSFQSLGLSDLEADTDYFYRIEAVSEAAMQFSNRDLPVILSSPTRKFKSETLNFRTLSQDAPPKTYYVSEQGSNSASGSEAAPWLSISYAATRAVAGDTILVYGGTYKESVIVRATGAKGRPLTIAAVPGEKPWLDGNLRQLNFGFSIFNKSHVNLDGFYMREIRQNGRLGTAGIVMINSNQVNINRFFYDGRSDGYTPGLIRASNCANLTLANCFITRAFHGMTLNSCKNLLIRNSVFYINQINSCSIHNNADQKAVLRNNIWVDNTLQKVPNPIIYIKDIAALDESDNCFLLRVPENEKVLFGYTYYNGERLPMSYKGEVLDRQWRLQGRSAREMATYADFLQRTGRQGSAVFANPGFKALPNFIRFESLEHWEKNYSKFSAQHVREEYHKQEGVFLPLDFSDFQATTPLLIDRKIGFSH